MSFGEEARSISLYGKLKIKVVEKGEDDITKVLVMGSLL